MFEAGLSLASRSLNDISKGLGSRSSDGRWLLNAFDADTLVAVVDEEDALDGTELDDCR